VALPPTGSPGPLRLAWRRLRTGFAPRVEVLPVPRDVVIDWDVPVRVRDGVVLRVNVFRPAAGGTAPVILSAHPYGKDRIPAKTRSGRGPNFQYRLFPQPHTLRLSALTSWEAPDPGFWVPRGYAVVNADLRGAGTSEGVGTLLSDLEADDVHDLIEWAGTQPWSTGRVGLLGVSYLAISQYKAAATAPPHLAAICPWEGLSDAYRDSSHPGGVREDGFSVIWGRETAKARVTHNVRSEIVARPDLDAWYASVTPRLEAIRVPMLVCGSFSDHLLHTRGSFEAFRRAASPSKWLYTHRGGKWSTFYGEDALAAQLEFFDHTLKNVDNGCAARPHVRLAIHDAGAEPVAVVMESQWPPADLEWRTLALDASTMKLGGSGATQPARASFHTRGRGLQWWWEVPEDMDAIGPMALRVHVSVAGADDVHLFVGLRKFRAGREVTFEGSFGFAADMMSKGFQRAAHRELDPSLSTPWLPVHTHRRPEPLRTGEIVAVDVALLPHATRLRGGDRLRLDVRGTWHYPRNPLTGAFPADYAPSPRGRCTVHTGGPHDSWLRIGTRPPGVPA
jgi:predicted acyl esterase